MTLPKEQYKAFEAIVGPENISDDPVDLDAWAWRTGQFALLQEFKPRFEAIVMPGSTEEVAAIVRLCNKLGVQFKASSTGWGVYCDPTGPGCIKLDMRRMNRIIEINEENMYAVCEPYVIHAQLQAELMKRGFCCNVNGAGGVTSAMPLVAHEGIGHMSGTCSISERNQLGAEWVTPEGDIIQLGALSALGEWFCGDGPGPSLRGILRGNVTALGGFGVFTKAALKIYHWAGPATVDVKGHSPYYVAQMPDNFRLVYLSWPDEDGRQAGIRALGENEVAFGVMGFNPNMVAANVATSNEEELVLADKFSKEIVGPGICVVIAGNSPRDFEYKNRVLEQIIVDTNATRVKSIEEGDVQKSFIWRFIRVTASIRETMRATGVFGGEVFGTDSYTVMRNAVQHSRVDKQSLIDRDLVFRDNIDPFITSLEQGELTHSEVLLRWTPGPDVKEGALWFVGRANQSTVDSCHGLPHHLFSDAMHDFFGPHTNNYTYWLRRIKKAYDPNNVSEGSNHLTAKDVV